MKKSILNNKAMVYTILIFYGLAVGYFIAKNSSLGTPPYGTLADFYMSLRVEWLEAAIESLSSTGTYTFLHRLYDHNAVMYLYLSYGANLLNTDALHTFFYSQLIFVYGCIAVYPAVIYRLTGKIYGAVCSVLFFALYSPYSLYLQNDSYFIQSWLTYLTVPVFIFLFFQKWVKSNWFWVIFIAAASALANVFRSSAGLSAVFLLAVLIFVKFIFPALKNRNIKNIAVSCAVLAAIVISQSIFTSFIPAAYQKITNQPAPFESKGPWHTLYVGLGWEENPWGLQYADQCGYQTREHLLYDVSQGYYIGIESPMYISAVKEEYFKTIFSDFGFTLSSYIRKSFTALCTAFKNSLLNIQLYSNGWFYKTKFALCIFILGMLCFIIRIMYKMFFKKDNIRSVFSPFALTVLGVLCTFVILGLLPGIVANPYVREYVFAAAAGFDMTVFLILLYSFIWAVQSVFSFVKSLKNQPSKELV